MAQKWKIELVCQLGHSDAYTRGISLDEHTSAIGSLTQVVDPNEDGVNPSYDEPPNVYAVCEEKNELGKYE